MVVTENERSMEHQWGSWLRESSRRGRLKMQEEAKVFLSCCKVLNFESLSVQRPTMGALNVAPREQDVNMLAGDVGLGADDGLGITDSDNLEEGDNLLSPP